MNVIRFVFFSFVLIAVVCILPVGTQAQSQNPALGIVIKSSGGSIDDAGVTEGATVYSGDYLSTNDHGLLLVRIGALSLQLEGSSAAHIYGAPYGAVVELNHGAVLYTTPGTLQNLIIVASDVRVTPALGTPDFGRVSIDDPCNLTVYSQRGTANAQVGSEARVVEEDKAYRVRALNEVDYRQYVSPDVGDYHNHHQHRECPALLQTVKGKPPIAPGHDRFLLIAAAVIIPVAVLTTLEALESPDRP